ncbi:hypothetical protein [Brevundimonas subvibrioides]|uniref:hypothetical protein n=1 Tax=Brevundimonas subvibrioides TaxID=74313 RepID=UPI0022B5A9E3|nr:hypothetical protein [Brevundimonas subvibrioides]
MRILTVASVTAITAFALAACQPAAGEKTAAAEPQQEIRSTTAPSVGGPTELPRDGGVTPTPEAMEGASAADVGAAVSPDEAAVLSGGEQNRQ